MKSSPKKLVLGIGLVAIGLGLGAGGIYVGETDDAPGAALIGLALMVALIVYGIRIARRKHRGTRRTNSDRADESS